MLLWHASGSWDEGMWRMLTKKQICCVILESPKPRSVSLVFIQEESRVCATFPENADSWVWSTPRPFVSHLCQRWSLYYLMTLLLHKTGHDFLVYYASCHTLEKMSHSFPVPRLQVGPSVRSFDPSSSRRLSSVWGVEILKRAPSFYILFQWWYLILFKNSNCFCTLHCSVVREPGYIIPCIHLVFTPAVFCNWQLIWESFSMLFFHLECWASWISATSYFLDKVTVASCLTMSDCEPGQLVGGKKKKRLNTACIADLFEKAE